MTAMTPPATLARATSPARIRFALFSTGAAFFLSGASALVYQVSWQRILALQSGIGIYSIAMIVACFMAGLGIGSHLGGVLSLRVRSLTALKLFAVLELGVALFGVSSCTIYYDWLYLGAGWLYTVGWRAFLLHFFGLLLPTALMGMSLPFLARAMVRDARSAGATVGYLYGVNVLGAAVGAIVTPWILIRTFGIRGAVTAAAIANLTAAVLALVATRWAATEGEAAAEDEAAKVSPEAEQRGVQAPPANARSLASWMALYACSGFCALALEIVWFRIVDVAVKSTAFTFGTVLAIYLLGLAIGSLAGVAMVRRSSVRCGSSWSVSVCCSSLPVPPCCCWHDRRPRPRAMRGSSSTGPSTRAFDWARPRTAAPWSDSTCCCRRSSMDCPRC